ncbi:hypothetical protein HFP15_23870 [Amycolatopsis sp. K13G38]|uniref:PPE domain-containing protein n=1 Tax=Amycolatopsis acididurans TaxID=2724524 RepID=A0ABX1J8C9_9PSEU|nr:hypothetical protein [Amycolatopsis acididurans]NKQ55919.1 hypothetical protein [Amycolatopsis acididurans]
MSTFDSSRYDIPELITKLRDQRFDGYGSEALAAEVAKFRDGAGAASMGDAVDALKQIATALAQTDQTLRQQLGALGVTWESQAGGQASAVMAEQAGFSEAATSKVSAAAQLIFQQGEAFNRTKNKLPDPRDLLKSGGGYTFGDTVFSLFGFETDHAKNVRAGLEARAQAVDALNAYAHDTGNYLASSEPVDAPQTLTVDTGGAPTAQPPITPVSPDISPTQAAGATAAIPAAAQAPAPAPQVHAPVADTATPAIGVPVRQTGVAASAPQPQTTAPSSATAPASAPATEAPVNVAGPVKTGSGPSETTARPATGSPVNPALPATQGPGGTTTGLVPGASQSGSGRLAPDSRSGSWAKTGFPADGQARAGAPQPGESLLGKGKMFGAGPSSSSAGANVGPGFSMRGAPGVSGLAEGAPAVGAAGVGGAVSGEEERPGRGRGRNTAGKRTQQLPVGDLPEEAEAQHAKRATPEPPSAEHTRAILEPAATQDGDEDALHVRKYGVDDRDLFADGREVSIDVIGEHRLSEDR